MTTFSIVFWLTISIWTLMSSMCCAMGHLVNPNQRLVKVPSWKEDETEQSAASAMEYISPPRCVCVCLSFVNQVYFSLADESSHT